MPPLPNRLLRHVVLVRVAIGELELHVQAEHARVLRLIAQADGAVGGELEIRTGRGKLRDLELPALHVGLEHELAGVELRQRDGVADLGLAVADGELGDLERDLALAPCSGAPPAN